MKSNRFLIIGLFATLVAGLTAILDVLLTARNSDTGSTVINSVIAGIAVILTISTAAITWLDRSRVSYRKIRISLVGAPRIGKTVYLTVLFDVLQSGRAAQFNFAPDPETINRVLGSMSAFAEGKWIARTPSDYLYLYSARISLHNSAKRRSERGKEYRLEIADVAGEQVGEFVPGERQYSEKTSYYSYTRGSDGLFLFIDYPAIDKNVVEPKKRPNVRPTQPLARQVNDLIFVIQSVADAAGLGPNKLLESPVAIIITKCDLAYTSSSDIAGRPGAYTQMDYLEKVTEQFTNTDGDLYATIEKFPVDARKELDRLIAVARARCRWVALFAVSSVGPSEGQALPPEHIRPINVAAPLAWMLEPRPTQIGRPVRE